MTISMAVSYEDLLRAIRLTKRRWRTKILLRGLAIFVVAGFAAFGLSVWGLNFFHYSSSAVVVFRVLLWLGLAAVAVRYLVLPLNRRLADEQVALYIEEHEPSLQEELLSAIEFGRKSTEEWAILTKILSR